MKTRVLLTALMIGIIVSATAQRPSITLTFTADKNGQHVPLNSILIENLSQGGDTILYAPDTVLILNYITGIESFSDLKSNGFSLYQNYPNPIKEKTTIDLCLPEKAEVIITVTNIIGRVQAFQEFQLERGMHSFCI